MLFDSVFCYFPITFRPPPNDPYGITAQDLKDRLRGCIAATGRFAPYALPQLIDKLDDTSPIVKKDAMQTIRACASSYGIEPMSIYSITLWNSLKFEILNAQAEDLAEEALNSLQAIAICLGKGLGSSNPTTPLANYLRPIIEECNKQLREPTQKQAKSAGRILGALGIASPLAFMHIVNGVFPLLETLYEAADSIVKQRALLEVIVQILDSAVSVYGTTSVPAPSEPLENPLGSFKDHLFEVSTRALMSTAPEEVSFRVVALKILLRLCMLRNFLHNNEIGMVVQHFDEIIFGYNSNGRDDLKKEAIQGLVKISRFKPNMIMEITFPAFMARLPDSCRSDDRSFLVTLEGLAQLSTEKFVSDTLIRRLLNKLDVVLQNDGPPVYPQAILSTLHYILSQRDLPRDPNLGAYHENIVVGLTRRVVIAAAGQGPVTALNEHVSLNILGRLATKIVQALDEHKQKSVALHVYTLFMEGIKFTPIFSRIYATPLERSTMILSTALIAGVTFNGMHLNVDEGGVFRHNILADLVKLALTEDITTIRQTMLRQVGLMTNKFLPEKDVSYVMDILRGLVTDLLESATLSENAVRVVFWISKGLILRLSNVDEVLERLLALLFDSSRSFASARGFGLLLAPDEILCKENGATVRLLAKQKVFNVCVPIISEHFRNGDAAVKPNLLVALSGILKYMPTEVIIPEIDALLPLLLQSLDLEDSNVKAATIQSLAVVSQKSPQAIEGHVGSLVTRLLKSAGTPKLNSMTVRQNALRCLGMIPGKVKNSNGLPYRNAVTRGLMTVLDDPKRQVRKEAVECRAAWLKMDEPSSD